MSDAPNVRVTYMANGRWQVDCGDMQFSGSVEQMALHFGFMMQEAIKLRAENAKLNIALFHVENGLSHPDPAVRKLIEAAMAAKEAKP